VIISLALIAAIAFAAAGPPPTPSPIGLGPRFHPAAASAPVLRGVPVAGLRCSSAPGRRFGVHLELFAHRQVVIVPAGVGVALPFRRDGAAVVPRGCTYPARTLAPAGVVELRTGSALSLGAFFRLWGQPLSRQRLAGFRSKTPILAFVGGRRWRGDPRAIRLTPHAQIVLELGGFVPPHSSFLFPGGL
jgi:hypothetical protein